MTGDNTVQKISPFSSSAGELPKHTKFTFKLNPLLVAVAFKLNSLLVIVAFKFNSLLVAVAFKLN